MHEENGRSGAAAGGGAGAGRLRGERRAGPRPEGATAQVDWPKERLETNEDGVPVLDVYVVADEAVERVDIETYVEGVLAGEMKNDWPIEALKAQAILARTFVLKFLSDKESRYEGADISTDIEEAQATTRPPSTTASVRPSAKPGASCSAPGASCPTRGFTRTAAA